MAYFGKYCQYPATSKKGDSSGVCMAIDKYAAELKGRNPCGDFAGISCALLCIVVHIVQRAPRSVQSMSQFERLGGMHNYYYREAA
jgi:hypothetical protein